MKNNKNENSYVLVVENNKVVTGVLQTNRKTFVLYLDKKESILRITENTFKDFEKLSNV